MKHLFRSLLVASLLLAYSASGWAFTVDFTDGVFTEITTSSQPGQPVVMGELAGGVNFTFTGLNNLVGASRIMPTGDGLRLGGGGGSTIQFLLEVDTDVTFNAYSTNTGGFFLGNAAFNVVDVTGVPVDMSLGNSLAQQVADHTLASGPLALLSGGAYRFDILNIGAGVQSFLATMDFDVTQDSSGAVPLSATLPLILVGVFAFALASAKRRQTA